MIELLSVDRKELDLHTVSQIFGLRFLCRNVQDVLSKLMSYMQMVDS